MSDLSKWCLPALALGGFFYSSLSAQVPSAKPVSALRVEPGLEKALRWKWWVAPSAEKDWGFPIPERPALPAVPAIAPSPSNPTPAAPDPATIYEVKRGDVLIRIAKRVHVPVAQLKTFNGLQGDMIHIGQVLKIPNADELKAMAVPTPAPAKPAQAAKADPSAAPKPAGGASNDMRDSVTMQVFLDRASFSPGPITGSLGATYQKILHLYQTAHPEANEGFLDKAKASVGEPFARYTLKDSDFRFIAPPKAERAATKAERAATPAPTAKRPAKGKPSPAATPPPNYEEMTSATMLAYRSPWEFVAERFHCDEGFLRSLNSKIKTQPAVGTEFQVPNVIPFEIENVFSGPLQPPPDPLSPVTAAVVELSRIEISRGNELIAVMPMALARPSLRGRGSWTILDVIPHPRMATLQEVREQAAQPAVSNFYVGPKPEGTPAPEKPPLASEQYLPAGPKNPVGILWINLGKAKSTEPLPYGLHGTSIPDRMRTQESLGGLRLTNWDIARAVHLLPKGTPLQWK